jgi:hypothetical protein
MNDAQTGRRAAASDFATDDRRRASVREQRVNDALRVLDEMHRLYRIERDDYRRQRRRLLDSLGDAAGPVERSDRSDYTGLTQRDTVRRAVPAGEPMRANTTVRPTENDGDAHNTASRTRGPGLRRAVMCVVLLAVIAGAAAACWFWMPT